MKTVTIPGNLHPFEATINNVHYGPYPAGSTQTVPDEVAAVIENYNASLPVEKHYESTEEEIARIAASIADTKVAEALDGYAAFVDLSSVSFTPGTPATITTQLPKADALTLIREAFDRPTSISVTYSNTKYTMIPTNRVGSGNSAFLVFSTPITSGGEVLGFIVFELSVEGNAVNGLLQFTGMPEVE
jgi:hypothetical protein